MPGRRHSNKDQAHLDQAAGHLAAAGAMPPKEDAAKALAMVKAARAVPAGFDPGAYAAEEAWDAAQAAQIIPQLAALLNSEMYEQDADGVAAIQACIEGLSRFIASEVADMGEALVADLAEDAPAAGMTAATTAHALRDSAAAGVAIQANPLKAISETETELVVGNYIVIFGGRDLSGFDRIGAAKPKWRNADGSAGTRFAADCQFESGYTDMGRLPVDWEHGIYADEGEPGRDDLLGYVDWATKAIDEHGVFVRRVLNRRNKYMQWIEPLIKADLVGTSSEAVEKGIKALEDGTITSWPLLRDTLTVAPAETRMMTDNVIAALKALKLISADQKPGQAAPDGAPAAGSQAQAPKESDMDAIAIKALTDSVATLVDLGKTQAENIKTLTTQNTELLTELRKPALKSPFGQVEPVKDGPERPFKSIGEQIQAVRARAYNRLQPEQFNKLEAVKAIALKATGANENIGSEGGDLVQMQFASDFFQRAYSTGAVISRCAKQPIGDGFNGIKIPGVDETSRVDGSRWGGLQSYWEAEGAPSVKSKALMRLVVLELHKLFLISYATDELVADAAGYTGYLNRTVPLEMNFKIENAIVRGAGGGIPQGFLLSPALVSVTKESNQAAATIVYNNVLKMYSRMWAGGQGPNIVPDGGSLSATVWLCNQDILPALGTMSLPVGTGGSAVFLPPGGVSGSPYGSLFGRPLIAIEQASTLGTVGDLSLVDLSQYVLADKGGVNAATSIHVQFLTDELTLRWTVRVEGKGLWNSALTPFQGTNTQSPFVVLATRS